MPSWPPGWRRAKSSRVKPRASSSAMARASPSARVAVVEAVGARLSGQASLSIATEQVDVGVRGRAGSPALPVIAISGTPEPLQGLDQAQQLLGGAGVGGGEHDVARRRSCRGRRGSPRRGGGRAPACRSRRAWRRSSSSRCRSCPCRCRPPGPAQARSSSTARSKRSSSCGEQAARSPRPRSPAPRARPRAASAPRPTLADALIAAGALAAQGASHGEERAQQRLGARRDRAASRGRRAPRSGSGWTSRKRPSAPAATAARASGSAKRAVAAGLRRRRRPAAAASG